MTKPFEVQRMEPLDLDHPDGPFVVHMHNGTHYLQVLSPHKFIETTLEAEILRLQNLGDT